LSAAGALEAERRQLTVMFVDLIDSTPLTERLDPEDMRRVLGIFHQACASAIEAHQGHIAQYIGDGLLVYFGYPNAHEDDAVRTVPKKSVLRAASPFSSRLRIQKTSMLFSKERRELRFRVRRSSCRPPRSVPTTL
jgi:class 3 adenylate cyclase